jgi:hypothetical protein
MTGGFLAFKAGSPWGDRNAAAARCMAGATWIFRIGYGLKR